MVQQAIELRDVSKKRHKRTIGPLNLSLPQGYITALVGQNGSGKSTLLHMLLQLSFPEEGEIRWFEQKHPGGCRWRSASVWPMCRKPHRLRRISGRQQRQRTSAGSGILPGTRSILRS